ASDRLVQRLADDLVESGLGLLGELLARVGVELDADAVLDRDLIGERANCGRKALVPEDDRLEVEREVSQLSDRRAVSYERPSDDLACLLVATLRDRVQPRVEQQRDAGQRLDRAVVEFVREPAPPVLLGGDELVRQ